MKAVGQRIGLPVEHREEYLRLHADVWPEVRQTIEDAGIRNYSIFLDGEDLFAYFELTEGATLESAAAIMAADPATQRWWALTDPLQRRRPETPDGLQWLNLNPIMRLE